MSAEVTVVEGPARTVSRRVVVNAPIATVFDLVANPHKHPELDGSGTVRDIQIIGPDRLRDGAKFTVGMKQYGVPYKITSTVVAFEENKVIQWQHPLGHTWRWDFEAVGDAQTQITETFDYSTAKLPQALELVKQPAKNANGITETLKVLAARFA